MSAKDEKLHVNNKEENWSVQIMQGFKVELVLDFVRVVFISVFGTSRVLFKRSRAFFFTRKFRNLFLLFLFKASSASVLTLYEKDIVNQAVTRMEELSRCNTIFSKLKKNLSLNKELTKSTGNLIDIFILRSEELN